MGMEFVMREVEPVDLFMLPFHIIAKRGKINTLPFCCKRWYEQWNEWTTSLLLDRFDSVGKNETSAAFYLTLDECLPRWCSNRCSCFYYHGVFERHYNFRHKNSYQFRLIHSIISTCNLLPPAVSSSARYWKLSQIYWYEWNSLPTMSAVLQFR